MRSLRYAYLLAITAIPGACGITSERRDLEIGYIAHRPQTSVAATLQKKALKIILMDTVEDYFEISNPHGGNAHIRQIRKSVADGLLISYRRTFPAAQITNIPQDTGNEVLVWMAKPRESRDHIMMAWRAEFLLDGRVVGELSGDDLGSTNTGNITEMLAESLAASVEKTYNTHMQVIGAFKNNVAPKSTKFLNRGSVFKVDGNNLTIASRFDFPGRVGQIFEIVDEKQKSMGRLRVQATYHTNFRAELLSGRAAAGAEVGVFVRQN